MVVLGLSCCTQAFSSCNKQGQLSGFGARASTVVASLAAVHGL